MKGKIKKIKESNGYVYPVTHSDAVFVNNKTLTQTLNELETPAPQEQQEVASVEISGSEKKKPVIVFLMDDTTVLHYDTMQEWINRGMRYTTGLRLDFIDSNLTYAKLKEMQDNGFEIAYHGTTHNFTVGELEADINNYLTTIEPHELKINGYIGANGLYDENIVFHKFFDVFKWARGAGASNGVANVKNPVDYFKLIKDSNSFIDDLTSTAAVDTLKPKIDALATRGTGILTLSMHMGSSQAAQIPALLDYIQSKGIEVMTVSEAYEIYGAVIEYYDSSLQLGEDFTKRVSGNGGTSVNAASPHFILMKDGTVISNTSGVKRITPVYKGQIINGNTLPDSFDVGISIVQYGSIDNRTGFPTTGTLYNFNLGKDLGQQFQLFKAAGKGGLYFRESNTDNTWKNSMSNKIGIFRSVPTSPTAAGFQGDFSADANYLYICHADNAWIRVPKDNTWV